MNIVFSAGFNFIDDEYKDDLISSVETSIKRMGNKSKFIVTHNGIGAEINKVGDEYIVDILILKG